jgi:hypothetical protein
VLTIASLSLVSSLPCTLMDCTTNPDATETSDPLLPLRFRPGALFSIIDTPVSLDPVELTGETARAKAAVARDAAADGSLRTACAGTADGMEPAEEAMLLELYETSERRSGGESLELSQRPR